MNGQKHSRGAGLLNFLTDKYLDEYKRNAVELAAESPGDAMKAKKKNHRTFVLAVEGDDPEKELEFELDFLATLTTSERFQRMLDSTRDLEKMWLRHGHRKPTSVVKRT